MSYHLDRFHSAVMVLAGDGHVKSRLLRAYEENLAGIPEDELPGDLKQDFCALKSSLTAIKPMRDEGPASATVRKMSASDASDCAVQVVSMYGEMLKRLTSDDDAAAMPLDENVSPFLVKSAS
ncbi:MAG: hypothetical protein AAGI27_06295 [Pseudomonadota bacterium]